MNKTKLRINAEFIFNALGASILIIIGLCVICSCFLGIVKLDGSFNSLSFDNEYETIISLFVAPFIFIAYIFIFAIAVILVFFLQS